MSAIKLFLRIEPDVPHTTHQQQKTVVRGGRPFRYEEPKLKKTRALYMSLLAPHAPASPMSGALQLSVKWLFAQPKRERSMWKTTRPDCDNLMKLLQDCMTALKFWNDDSQIAVLNVQKLWVPKDNEHGIYIKLERINEDYGNA